MINCLSNSRFANLLFVNIKIGNMNATALFDTSAGMTVITQSLLHRLHAAPVKEALRAGNNNGVVRAYFTVKWAVKNGVKAAVQEMKETEETT